MILHLPSLPRRCLLAPARCPAAPLWWRWKRKRLSATHQPTHSPQRRSDLGLTAFQIAAMTGEVHMQTIIHLIRSGADGESVLINGWFHCECMRGHTGKDRTIDWSQSTIHITNSFRREGFYTQLVDQIPQSIILFICTLSTFVKFRRCSWWDLINIFLCVVSRKKATKQRVKWKR